MNKKEMFKFFKIFGRDYFNLIALTDFYLEGFILTEHDDCFVIRHTDLSKGGFIVSIPMYFKHKDMPELKNIIRELICEKCEIEDNFPDDPSFELWLRLQ